MSMEKNPLLVADAEGGHERFEAVWLELLEAPPPADVFLKGLKGIGALEDRELAMPLLTLLLESCKERGEHAQVLAVARALVPLRPRRIDLMTVAREALLGAYASEPWCELFVELSGLEGADVEQGIESFEHMRRLLPGSPVYHGTGWGEGVVSSADYEERTISVTFRSDGRERVMPFTTGLDVLRTLDRDDLRARFMIDIEGLERDAADDPAALVRAVAKLGKGRCTAKDVKQWLAGTVIPESAWTGWWKKAKAAAANDAWLIVENPARPTFIVRRRPLSPAEAVGESLSRARTLKAVLEVARGPLALEPDQAVLERLLDCLTETMAAQGGKPVERVEATLMLCRHGRGDPAEAGQAMQTLIDEGHSFGALLGALSPASVRRDALDAYIAAQPELWSDAVIGDLASVPATLLDVVSDKLQEAGRGEALANRLKIFLLSPSRQPATVLRLCRRWALGQLDGLEDSPGVADVLTGVLHLAETQAPKAERGDKDAKEVMRMVIELLAHKKARLFARFGKEASRPEMERAMSVVARCPTMPSEVSMPLQAAVHVRFPDLVPRDDTPFWEGNAILCSRAGLARRNEEYRVLLEEKIPENSVQIGKAAAFGDLSENYEWTAAIEQQRQLTEKAAVMEAELKLARAIEDEELPDGIVAPGTKVSYEQDGETKTLTILGPWDVGEGLVSYRAPLAAGMLGSKPGDTVTLNLPSGDVTVTVRSVEKAV